MCSLYHVTQCSFHKKVEKFCQVFMSIIKFNTPRHKCSVFWYWKPFEVIQNCFYSVRCSEVSVPTQNHNRNCLFCTNPSHFILMINACYSTIHLELPLCLMPCILPWGKKDISEIKIEISEENVHLHFSDMMCEINVWYPEKESTLLFAPSICQCQSQGQPFSSVSFN